ncbi:MAG: hypothetical protein P8X90_31155 [Desulfobacterales bacterium]
MDDFNISDFVVSKALAVLFNKASVSSSNLTLNGTFTPPQIRIIKNVLQLSLLVKNKKFMAKKRRRAGPFEKLHARRADRADGTAAKRDKQLKVVEKHSGGQ